MNTILAKTFHKNRREFFLVFLVTAVQQVGFVFGQSNRLEYADRMYEAQSYYDAVEAYEDVLERKVDSTVVAQRLSMSYDKIGRTPKAIEWYRYRGIDNLVSEELVRLALLEREVGDYDASHELLNRYEQRFGSTNLTRSLLGAIDQLPEFQKGMGIFELRTVSINEEHSEIGPSFYLENEIILARSKRNRMVAQQIHSWTGNYFYDLYKASITESGDLGKPQLLKSTVSTKFHDGPASFDPVNNYLYFSRNNYLNGDKGVDENNTMLLKIYRVKWEGGKFKDEEELSINSDQFSTTHPAISADGTRLFFASDRPGGMGGMDIYYVDIQNGEVIGEPVNLGERLNTEQDDVFPAYHAVEHLVFFASDGHPGLGGLDIFVAKMTGTGAISKVENLGAPINSRSDDFSFVSNSEQTMGYFASNREGGQGDDDIYGFKQTKAIKNTPILSGVITDLGTGERLDSVLVEGRTAEGRTIEGLTTMTDSMGYYEMELVGVQSNLHVVARKDGYSEEQDTVVFDTGRKDYRQDLALTIARDYLISGRARDKETLAPLDQVKVTLYDNRRNEVFSIIYADANGKFKSSILPYAYQDSVDYTLKFEKEGYLTKTQTLKEVLDIEANRRMDETLRIDLTRIEEGVTNLGDELVDFGPIYFDLNSSYIREDAAKELDHIVDIMNEHPGMVIEVGSHTDTRDSDEYNRWLSDRRARSTVNYIVSQGISPKRIYGKGYGETQLKVTDAEIERATTIEEKEALHQKNRRTDFIIVKIK